MACIHGYKMKMLHHPQHCLSVCLVFQIICFVTDFLNVTTSAYDFLWIIWPFLSFYSEHWQISMLVGVNIQLLLHILFQFMLWCYEHFLVILSPFSLQSPSVFTSPPHPSPPPAYSSNVADCTSEKHEEFGDVGGLCFPGDWDSPAAPNRQTEESSAAGTQSQG